MATFKVEFSITVNAHCEIEADSLDEAWAMVSGEFDYVPYEIEDDDADTIDIANVKEIKNSEAAQ